MNGASDLVTVVVPAKDEEGFIGPCLDSVLAQDHRNLQVIVVDGGSSDQTVAVVLGYAGGDPRVELVRGTGVTIPSSLNAGLARARGRFLVRVDAHSTIPPDYVGGIVAHLRTGRWGGVGGRKEGIGRTPAGRAIATALRSKFGVGNSRYHYATERQVIDHVPFGAYRTDVLRDLGGWDERLEANEDFELDYRLGRRGYRLLFDPKLSIAWHSRQSIGDLFRQYRRYGRGKAAVALLHPRSVKPRHLAAPALVVAGVAAATLAVLGRWTWGAVVLMPYVIALAWLSAISAIRMADRRAAKWLPVAFLTMHAGWGLGFWEGILTRAGRSPVSPGSRRVPDASQPPGGRDRTRAPS